MRSRIEFQRSVGLLLRSTNTAEMEIAAAQLRADIDALLVETESISEQTVKAAANAKSLAKKEQGLLLTLDRHLETIPDEELLELNLLLPWAAMTADLRGRIIGDAWSPTKRATVHAVADRRHVAFNEVFPLRDKHVLEVGCFEGIHTLSCLNFGARVTAIDGRIENIVKTLTRLWLYGRHADTVLWDVECEPHASVPEEWDVLHHIGVLYHLRDPVAHLNTVLSRTKQAVILDTHVARDSADAAGEYQVAGKRYRFREYREKDLEISPFSGLYGFARWLMVEDLMELLASHGFRSTKLVENRDERNGRRVLIWGLR